MGDAKYRNELMKRLSQQKKELEALYEKREQHVHNKENWYHVQCAINIKSVDIQTTRSRIENVGNFRGGVADSESVNTVNKYSNN